jgi:hypothetical protein
LSADQVACEERQLERLQHRMWLRPAGSSHVHPNLFSGEFDGRVAFLLRLRMDEAGRLIDGDLSALPWCTLGSGEVGCTFIVDPGIALFVLPPLLPGLETQGEAEFARAARLNLEFEGSEFNVLSDSVNWVDLLRDTSWNGGPN